MVAQPSTKPVAQDSVRVDFETLHRSIGGPKKVRMLRIRYGSQAEAIKYVKQSRWN
jgi:hypothetical protein